MKARNRNKIYNRATKKLDCHRKQNDRRTYVEQLEEDESLLSPLERKVFRKEQERFCRITDILIEELKAEGKW